MSAHAFHFDVLKVEEGLDSDKEETPAHLPKKNNKTKKNKKKVASARKDINNLLKKLNNPTDNEDFSIVADSLDNINSNSHYENEIELAIKHSEELGKPLLIQEKKNNNQQSDNRKSKSKSIITMSLQEFTSGDTALTLQSIQKTDMPLEKALPYDNEEELARSGFFTSAKAEKQYKANIEKKMLDEINLKNKQSTAEIKMKEKQKKLLETKEQEIVRLKDLQAKLLEELGEVKKRNYQLNFMMKTPEMEGKLKAIKEIEELNQFINEMTVEILERQNDISLEINSNNELRNHADKLKSFKPAK